jgi:DNA-binding response OmpR family regulator
VNEQVLLVEDDDAIADALRLHLEEAGYRLHREADGLPGDGGHRPPALGPGAARPDAARRRRLGCLPPPARAPRRRAGDHAQRPQAEAHRVLGLELGADDYLPSPFRCWNWWRVCAPCCAASSSCALRRRRRRSCASALPAGHRARRELRAGQTLPVPLTLREFDLLHFLARHPASAFSRSELLQRVWGAGFDGYEHTVNSHINRLRTKIEDDPREPRASSPCGVWATASTRSCQMKGRR